MLIELFKGEIQEGLKKLNFEKINEIRLRLNSPIIISIQSYNFYLNKFGLTNSIEEGLFCTKAVIENVLSEASNQSIHSINDQIVNGYISVRGGIRIGVAGEVVVINGNIKTVKNITSLNIRIPHEVKNCSLNAYPFITKNGIPYNTLILSPAGLGKTTFIRDFAKQLILRNKDLNILIVDERYEISGISEGFTSLGLNNVDIICNSKKKYAFENGIRSLKPDVIITDEINLYSDLDAIENAISSGVKVIATIHASSINDLRLKLEFNEVLEKGFFERFLVLGKSNGIGTIEGIFDSNLNCIGC